MPRGGARAGAGRPRGSTQRRRSRRSTRSVGVSTKKRVPLALKTHNFVERTNPQELTVAEESAAVGLFKTFEFSQCLQVGSYTELFEYYKINKVVCTFRYKGASTPAYTTVPATSSGNQATYAMEINNEINPVLYVKIDYDDITADSLATLKKSSRTKEIQFTNDKPTVDVVFKPAIQAMAYKTAVTTGYMPKWNQWLRTTDDTIPHYGLKVYAVAGKSNNPNMGKIEVTTKIYFSCKSNN